jgi:hypothetical protein
LTGGASAISAGGGTIVGRLVSITTRSGHLCRECSRMIDLSTSARAGGAAVCGMYQSARNNSASNTLPTKAKYRPRGIPTTIAMIKPPRALFNSKNRQSFPLAECLRTAAGIW